jgi:uncharacterized protein YecT (DUF1311 family)
VSVRCPPLVPTLPVSALLVPALIVVLTGLAWGPAQAASCGDTQSTAERRDCYGAELQRADHRLNLAYQALMKTPALDAQARTLLRDSQRAWLSFRDAQCAWQSDEMRGGTEAPVIAAACLGSLTAERATQLESDLKDRSN